MTHHPTSLIPAESRGDLLVVGGGIAGLSASLALAASGLTCEIFERRSEDAFAGMGFLLTPNGVTALEALCSHAGVELSADDIGVPLTEMCLFSHSGAPIASRDAGGAYGVSRPLLLSALTSSCERLGVRRHLDRPLASARLEGDGVHMMFEGNDARDVRDARCLLGADGVRSPLRSALFPTTSLSRSEILEFVGVSPLSALLALPLSGPLGLGGARDPRALVKLQDAERRLAFGYMPLPNDEVIWHAQMAQEDGEMPYEDGRNRRAALIERFEGWPPVVHALLSSCPFERTYRWDTCDLPPLATARREGALLIGDAAHASLTLSSQGVSGALEDALELALLADELHLSAHAGSAERLAEAWRDLTARFEERRAPVWRRRYDEARSLQRDFLSGDTSRGVPVVSP